QLSTANSRAFTSWLFGAEGTQHGHNALRVLFSLRTLADLPAADFDRAMAETAWFEAACSAFTAGFVEARRRFLVEVIGNRAPWTPAQLRKMTDAEIKALPPRPDWLAIQAQLQLAKDAWGSA
uniref:hypothetical protein n=1 Tax=Lamprocystis purpurea TaxID=61598 RepID=UPI0012FB625E